MDSDMLRSASTSTSIRRLPGSRSSQTKGSSQHVMFRPGGMGPTRRDHGFNGDDLRAFVPQRGSLRAGGLEVQNLVCVPPAGDPQLWSAELTALLPSGVAGGGAARAHTLALPLRTAPERRSAHADVAGGAIVHLGSLFADSGFATDSQREDTTRVAPSTQDGLAAAGALGRNGSVAPPGGVRTTLRSEEHAHDASGEQRPPNDVLSKVEALLMGGSSGGTSPGAAIRATRGDSEWVVDHSGDHLSEAQFRKRVPSMAIEYPFELDSFQKLAIVQLEQGHNVFTAAHTSAGKTVVAEYGIALATQHCTKAIYTSPIKTLSNQKFREFSETFESVGIVTGDVSINPKANCVIMTTEILRSMLYKGADMIRDVEWVIFDEVHYLNDEERGVVWEEVIIMLPQHVGMIMLSATVPNTLEVAEWIGRTKAKPVHVVSTSKRPVPLEHYLLAKAGHRFKIVNSAGKYLPDGYKAATTDEKAERAREIEGGKAARGQGPAGKQRLALARRGKRGQQSAYGRAAARGRSQHEGRNKQRRGGSDQYWKAVVDRLAADDILPVVVFTFGKKKCEECGYGLSTTDLTSAAEKAATHRFISDAITRLSPPDRGIPQIVRIRELLKRGIGVHHAGLLPIVKEIVEMLFARSLVKVLFATETFAMGVNMPTRTVIFNGIRKNDGHGFRELLPGEYTQMSGRAGRRGLDSTGLVLLSVGEGSDMPSEHILKTLTQGQPKKLDSRFRLTYNMILNLLARDCSLHLPVPARLPLQVSLPH